LQIVPHLPSQLSLLDLGCLTRLNYQCLQLLHAHCKNLKSLCLYNCWKVQDQEFSQFFLNCPSSLTDLSLRSCLKIGDSSLIQLAARCSQLENLDLTNLEKISDTSLHHLLEKNTNLRELKLRNCHKITHNTLESIAKYCPNLELLDYTGCPVDNEVLSDVARACSKIQELTFRDCTNLQDSSIKNVGKCLGKNLLRLDFTNCSLLTDECLITIGKKCIFLVRLDLQGCHKISDIGIKYLLVGCTRLEKLDMHGCISVTEDGVISILGTCIFMHKLNVLKLKVGRRLLDVLRQWKTHKLKFYLGECQLEVTSEDCAEVQAENPCVNIHYLNKF